ncbi:dolichyl-phosphate beta-glucosyltransferase isoform X2 [Columba livia]|uniref:dolichyl-phosphate beta-glucosyltransferase isoform X2 n=1 Tax=Columba livia TaxID=8932 RepID=UPI0031BA3272
MALPLSLPGAAVVLAGLAALLLVLVVMIAHVTAVKMPTLHRHEEEKFFINAEGLKEAVPSIHDPPTKELSVVVPSYNEEDRLPLMMDEALDYLEKRQKRDPSFTYEVIVVDDGSKDQTTQVAMKYCKKFGSDKVRVLSLVKNRGKGGAVRMGVFISRGKKILMADADGATKFADIEKVEEGLENLQPWPNQMAISCGSRAHLEKDSIAKRSYFRTLLMYGFHFLVWFLCVKEIRDTQCGFKLLTREAALRTFSTLHIERWLVTYLTQRARVRDTASFSEAEHLTLWAFDVELLYIAQCFRIPIAEVAVNWTEIEGSKLVPFWSWLQMGRDLLFIRLRYMTGAWQLETRKCN